ncbi:MAG: ribonuclease HII [Armatimonadetes bacterium 55-13]|nr:MAG: ribonuclease HII [Armatimonadetes bacterium 55-13]
MTKLEHFPGAAGLDEAGRGPLAGPVTPAAVILPDSYRLPGLNDSKKLDAAHREELEAEIKACAQWTVCFVEPAEIDRLNILHASMAAMERCIQSLGCDPLEIYVDGNRVPRSLLGRAQAVVKGDGKIACIAAASILAKTARDRYMVEMAAQFHGYGFERHFGYPTPEHFEAIKRLGPCDIHRRSFAPVRQFDQGVLAL